MYLSQEKIGFRPLAGKWFESLQAKHASQRLTLFPSPCGEMIWIVHDNVFQLDLGAKVSVPLRGNDLNLYKNLRNSLINPCFRPLAGKWFESCSNNTSLYYSKKSFRPLAGKWFESFLSLKLKISMVLVSVPLRGNDLNQGVKIDAVDTQTCFRPLAGKWFESLRLGGHKA